jgi:hypothetical protein
MYFINWGKQLKILLGLGNLNRTIREGGGEKRVREEKKEGEVESLPASEHKKWP